MAAITDPPTFLKLFAALTGNPPFPWQCEMYKLIVAGRWDDVKSCAIPTGLGKTAVIPIWLIALANMGKDSDGDKRIPRRLVYVVNRRTVVDQASDEAKNMRDKLENPTADIAPLADALRGLCSDPETKNPLAISTLRGQMADNGQWSADPARPAIIVGTVDMIGSRLLFSGYGLGFKRKPLHAGFLGQDALLVHDEAHLEPAFQDLLTAIEQEQKRCKEFQSFRVMELSATSRAMGQSFTLGDADFADPEVRTRFGASKAMRLIENHDPKKLADEIAQRALEHDATKSAVLIFVRRVDDVERIVKKLPPKRWRQLTGTLRGYERDELVKDAIFQRYLPNAGLGDETVYLVCTSAGEVGINISADHLVCDLSTFDSMAQRFGRVNRFGLRDDTRIDILHPTEFDENDPYESRLKKTLDLMKKLNGDGSPAAIAKLDADLRQAAFAPPPTTLPTSDILFDAWALTTIRGKLPGRPMVEPYLHGISESQPPETHVAWREEVGVIVGALRDEYKPEDLLEDYPLKPHELLRDNSSRVFERLKKLKAGTDLPVWVVSDDDSIRMTTLGELIEDGRDELNGKTVLLPPAAGGLENGMLTGEAPSANNLYDVSDQLWNEKGQQRRIRVWDEDPVRADMRLIRPPIDTRPDAEESEEEESTGRRFWRWHELPTTGDTDGSKFTKNPVAWLIHTNDVVKNATDLVAKLPLSDDLKQAVILAAKFHDLGKKRRLWQRSIGNPTHENWLAKSGRRMKTSSFRTEYRHEFGSLLDLQDEDEFKALTEKPDVRELILHLIAVHHGLGRPHFPIANAFDPEHPQSAAEMVAAEVPRRFARLQRRYSRWGLAYLESLLRAADYAASAKPSEFVMPGEEEQQ